MKHSTKSTLRPAALGMPWFDPLVCEFIDYKTSMATYKLRPPARRSPCDFLSGFRFDGQNVLPF